MPDTKWSMPKRIRFSLFVLGILLTVFAWFLNNAIDMKPILNILAPEYLAAKDMFDQLDQTEESKVQ